VVTPAHTARAAADTPTHTAQAAVVTPAHTARAAVVTPAHTARAVVDIAPQKAILAAAATVLAKATPSVATEATITAVGEVSK